MNTKSNGLGNSLLQLQTTTGMHFTAYLVKRTFLVVTKADMERHCAIASHKNMASATKNNRSISSLFQSSTNNLGSLCQATTTVEILHTNFIAQHNMSFLTADHVTHLYPKMFPDSKIAKQFACSCIKTSCILNDVMMPNLHDYIKSNQFILPQVKYLQV